MLVTTLTKRMAEDLTQYYQELGVRVRYLHSDIETLERVEILRDLRRGEFDVLVGINLLREGLDLPEVSLVAILDADKEGFLRSAGSLIQTSGRAARNVQRPGDHVRRQVTDSMRAAIAETDRRRAVAGGVQQRARHHAGVDRQADRRRAVERVRARLRDGRRELREAGAFRTQAELDAHIAGLEREMREAAANLDFERAAALRDRVKRAEAHGAGSGRPTGGAVSVPILTETWLKRRAAGRAGVRALVVARPSAAAVSQPFYRQRPGRAVRLHRHRLADASCC